MSAGNGDDFNALLDAEVEAVRREWATYPPGHALLRQVIATRSIKGTARVLRVKPEALMRLTEMPPRSPDRQLRQRILYHLGIPLAAWSVPGS